MAVFIVVPVLAPSLGAVALRLVAWRELVLINIAIAVVVLGLIVHRLEETLPATRREPVRLGRLARALHRIATDPRSGPLVLGQAILFAAFASYLGTFEVIVGQVYARPTLFPIAFGSVALVAGLAAVVNGRIVERVGIDRMIRAAFVGHLVGSATLVVLAVRWDGRPPLALWGLGLAVVVFNHATLIPNLASRAMEPMGDVAGIASAVAGSLLIGGGGLIGSVLDRAYDGTVRPLSSAFLVTGVVAALLHLVSAPAARRRDHAVSPS